MYSIQNKFDDLKIISKKLKLSFETQDWGIINSDPDRLEEFLNFYNLPFENPIKYELFELIIASYNDAIVEKKNSIDLDYQMSQFIKQCKNSPFLQPIIQYWINIISEEYPVGHYLDIA